MHGKPTPKVLNVILAARISGLKAARWSQSRKGLNNRDLNTARFPTSNRGLLPFYVQRCDLPEG